MRWWTGKDPNGLAYIEAVGETSNESESLAALYPSEGFTLSIREVNGRQRIALVPVAAEKPAAAGGETPTPPRDWQKLDIDQLQTECAERGIAYKPNERKADLIRKLNQAG